MITQIQLSGITVDVLKKDIKNVHLSVHPPTGRVRIAAPSRMNLETIRVFAISKLAWIKRQQHAFQDQERETPREYLDRESHYVWGRRYLLEIREEYHHPQIELRHNRLRLYVHPHTPASIRRDLLEEWYRAQVLAAVPELLAKWEPLIGVKVNKVFVRRMKTKWGSCNPASGNIRLNTDVAKKPPQSLEYLLVHEMVHLLEPTHNDRFHSLMDRFVPNWKFQRDILNTLPVRYETWEK